MYKNIIFAKKSPKICIFEKKFVTLQPIKSVVRFLRTIFACRSVFSRTTNNKKHKSTKYEKTFPNVDSDCSGSPDFL